MSRQAKKNAKRDAKIAAEYAELGLSASEPKHEAPHKVAGGWCEDFVELAERIYKEGIRAVPNHDRDTLAKGLPRGSATRRDGTSVRPVYDGEN